MSSGRVAWLPVVSVLLVLSAAYVCGFLIMRSRCTSLDTTGRYRALATRHEAVWWAWRPCIVIDEQLCQTTWMRIE